MSRPSIYLFCGSNSHAISEKVSVWRREFVRKHGNANLIVLSSTDWSSPSDVCAQLKRSFDSNTLFSTTTLVVLKGFLGKGLPEDVKQFLLGHLEGVSGDTFVVFEDSDIDKRGVLYKLICKLKDAGRALVEFSELPQGKDLQDWIVRQVHAHNCQITPVAASHLFSFFNIESSPFEKVDTTHLIWQLSSEIDKLCAYAAGRAIDVDDVDAIVIPPPHAHVFRLTDAMLSGTPAQLARITHDLLSQSGGPISSRVITIVSMLRAQYRDFVLLRSMMDEGLSEKQIAEEMGWNPKRVWVVSKKLSSSSLAGIKNVYAQLLRLDDLCKSSRVPADALLDVLYFTTRVR